MAGYFDDLVVGICPKMAGSNVVRLKHRNRPQPRALSGVGLSILDNLTRLEESRLHDDHAGFELSFGRAFEQLIDFFLHLLADLLLSTFLAYRAGNILDFHGGWLGV
jgi:hypothetical protein